MAQTFGIFYNPEILSARPASTRSAIETWDDLIAAAPKFKAADKFGLSISCNPTTSSLDFFLPLLTQVTDDPTFFLKLDQQHDGLTWEDPTVVKAIELNKRIVEAGVFQPGTTGTSGDAGRAALLHREGRDATSPAPGRRRASCRTPRRSSSRSTR